MKRKNLSPGALTAPLPPCMVTVGDMENNNILTVAWTGILATVPPRTYISVRPSRYSYGMLGVGREFVINLPPASLAKEVDFVGIYTGAKMDKFERCSLTRIRSDKVAPPTVAECPIALECRVTEVIPMGSHHVFMADIVGISCREELIDSEGKIHFENADLLAYAHGEYYTLGNRVGKFGFSTDRPKKQENKAVKTNERQHAKEEERPFYETAPKGSQKKKLTRDKNKGKPHGKRAKVGNK